MATIFKNGNVILGTGEVIEKGAVAINDNMITFVRPTKNIRPSKKDKVFDISGKTILPGLIDAHVHLSGPYDPYETNIVLSILKTPPPLIALWAVKNANVCMEAGCTTLRDMGVLVSRDSVEMISVRRGMEMGLVDGPRLLVSGLVIQTSSHGEMASLGRLTPWVDTAYGVSDGPWEVRKRVRHLVGLDVDFIKVIASGWSGEVERNWWPNFTLEELTAICDEAHRYHKRVAAHVASAGTMLDAARAGCDTLEHLVEIDDQTIETILKRNIILVPTLSLFSERALSRRGRHQKPAVIEQLRQMTESAIPAFQRCLKAGVRMAMGTDLYRTTMPGENALEIALLVEHGMSEMDAIVTATKNSAEACGLSDQLGTVTPGKWADLLLVAGDPLQDIRILEDKNKIRLVMKGGEIKVDRRLH